MVFATGVSYPVAVISLVDQTSGEVPAPLLAGELCLRPRRRGRGQGELWFDRRRAGKRQGYQYYVANHN